MGKAKLVAETVLRNAERGAIHHEGGLVFRFLEKGVAGVRYIGRIAGTGHRISIGLGRYPQLKLGAARVRRDEIARQCAAGQDPRHVRREKAQAQQQLVEAVLLEYLAAQTGNRPSTVRDKRNTLIAALKPWAKRPVNTLGKADVSRLKDAYASKPFRQRSLFAYVSHFLGWCVDRDLISHNPCRQLKAPKPIPPRERTLTEGEIEALLTNGKSTWATMLKIMLLTGQRGGEVCKMRISEIDLALRTWTIPAETMKQGRSHVVPLSSFAAEIIASEIEQRPAGWGPYLFGVGSNGARPYNGRSNGMEEVLRQTGTSGWRGQDCRRTATSIMQELGIPREVRTTVTGHARPRDGASAYETHRFTNEARDAVERLGRRIMGTTGETASVVPIRSAVAV